MKRTLVALGVFGVLFATAFGLAATLDVDAGAIQAGGDTDLTCDTDEAVSADLGFDYDESEGAYVVTGVIVEGIETPACDGATVSVTLTGTGGSELATEFAVHTGGGSVTVPFTEPVADVEDVHVLIKD